MEPDGPAKKQVRVSIFNQTYNLRTSGEEGETEELARLVDELMNSIAGHSGTLDSGRIAVLACLHLADRLRSLERDLDDLRRRVERKSRDFSILLDQAMQAGG
jgi:cell division protein ZapA